MFWVRPPAWRLSPQQRTCRRPSEGWLPRSTRGEEAAGGGSHDGREKRELSSSTTSRPPWKVAREARGPVANGKPGSSLSPRAFDPLTFRQGKRRWEASNLSRKQGWRGNARGFDSSAFRARRQSQLDTTLVSHTRGRGSIPRGGTQCEVAQLAERPAVTREVGGSRPSFAAMTRGPDGKARGCRPRPTRFDSETRLQAGQVLTDAQLASNQQEWGQYPRPVPSRVRS